jgi:hypothetical protein
VAERSSFTAVEHSDLNATWALLLSMARERLPEGARASLDAEKTW